MRILSLFVFIFLFVCGCSGPVPMAEAQPPVTSPAASAPTSPSPTASAYTPASEPFTPEDLVCGPVAAGCRLDAAKAALGEPDDEQEQVDPGSGETLILLRYGANQLTFSQGMLTEADFHDVELTGPRGLRTGDPVTMVEAAYGLTGDGSPYYEHTGGLPPRGEKLALEGDASYTILLTAPLSDYDAEILSQPLAYMEEKHAQLVYTIDATSQRITAIHWIVAPLSESGE